MTTSHSAAASAAGYQYQTWLSLFQMLKVGQNRPDARITLELYDDIAWEEAGTPTELLQTKHHSRSSPSLTDSSEDLWKTIKAWLDSGLATQTDGPQLHLITTSTAPSGSIASALTAQHRDVGLALELLNKTARNSTAASTENSRRAFLALPNTAQVRFISRITIVDGSPLLEEVDGQVRRELQWALPDGHADMFMELLWGWWDQQAVKMLRGLIEGIAVRDVRRKISELRDNFALGNLPTLVEVSHLDLGELQREHRQHIFYRQLELVQCPPRNLARAVGDYYRAYVHSTRWADDDLIQLDELEEFEEKLIDEWEREFEFMSMELGNGPDAEMKARVGLDLYRKLLDSDIAVRPRHDEPFFARGKRHELADTGRMGWHVDFKALLADVLNIQSTDAG